MTGKGTIRYQYDAAGNKLSKTVNEGSAQKITTYQGGMIFENDVLQHVGMEEGRFRPVTLPSGGQGWAADYFLKDHLGNVRSMINEDKTLLEETHYYPFGLSMKGVGYQNTNVVKNKIKFNGYEEQKIEFSDGSGLDWYDYKNRFYDNQIGRFFAQDKLADKYPYYAPYQFAGNEVPNAIDLDGLEPGYIHPDGYYVGPSDNLRRTIPKGAIISKGESNPDTKRNVSFFLDLVPYVNGVKFLYERFTGKDAISGEKLTFGESGILVGLPVLSKAGGKWVNVAESMSDEAASYQKQITGVSAEMGFKVSGVKFDGITKEGVLLDTKSGMQNFVGKDGKFRDWFGNGKDGLLNQANRQLKVADGTKIRWHFENKSVMEATQELFKKNKIEGIELIYTPRK